MNLNTNVNVNVNANANMKAKANADLMSEKGKDMDNFEKIEKLVQKAGVSYGDAKRVLEQANGDLLDAMIILENEGKVKSPGSSTYSTKYEEQSQYVSVPVQVENARMNSEERFGAKLKRVAKKIWHFLSANAITVMNKDGEIVANFPLWGPAIALLFFWWISIILLIVSLFMGYRYSFSGEADLNKVNEVMDKASNAADKVKEEYHKL